MALPLFTKGKIPNLDKPRRITILEMIVHR